MTVCTHRVPTVYPPCTHRVHSKAHILESATKVKLNTSCGEHMCVVCIYVRTVDGVCTLDGSGYQLYAYRDKPQSLQQCHCDSGHDGGSAVKQWSVSHNSQCI